MSPRERAQEMMAAWPGSRESFMDLLTSTIAGAVTDEREACAAYIEEKGDSLAVYGDCSAGRMECRSACADVDATIEAFANGVRNREVA